MLLGHELLLVTLGNSSHSYWWIILHQYPGRQWHKLQTISQEYSFQWEIHGQGWSWCLNAELEKCSRSTWQYMCHILESKVKTKWLHDQHHLNAVITMSLERSREYRVRGPAVKSGLSWAVRLFKAGCSPRGACRTFLISLLHLILESHEIVNTSDSQPDWITECLQHWK